MAKVSKRILDTETKKVYPSMYKAGLALYSIVEGGDKNDNYVWYKIQRAFPERFQVEVEGKFQAIVYASTVAAKKAKEQEYFLGGSIVKESELTVAQKVEVGVTLSDEEMEFWVGEQAGVREEEKEVQGEPAAEPSVEQISALVQTYGGGQKRSRRNRH